MKYSELLKKSKEAINLIKVPFKVKKAKKSLELKIAEAEDEISDGDLAVQEEKSSHPPNWDRIIDKTDERDLLARKLKLLNELKDELF